jgi:hypothetical protein
MGPRVTPAQLANAGSVAELIAKLPSGTQEVKEKTAKMLAALAEQNVDNVMEMVQKGAVPPLVQLLSSGTVDGQLYAAAALASIAANNSAHQAEIIKAGAIVPLVQNLRMGGCAVQEQAAAALASLTADRKYQQEIMDAGSIVPLVSLLRGGKGHTQVHAAAAIANLYRRACAGPPGTRPSDHAGRRRLGGGQGPGGGRCGKAGGAAPDADMLGGRSEATDPDVPLLVSLLSAGGEAQGYATATLRHLANCKSAQKLILDAGATEPLQQLASGEAAPGAGAPGSWLQAQAEDVLVLLGVVQKVEGFNLAAAGGSTVRTARRQSTAAQGKAAAAAGSGVATGEDPWASPDESEGGGRGSGRARRASSAGGKAGKAPKSPAGEAGGAGTSASAKASSAKRSSTGREKPPASQRAPKSPSAKGKVTIEAGASPSGKAKAKKTVTHPSQSR